MSAGKVYGFVAEDYQEFARFISTIAKRREFRSALSYEYIEIAVIDWVKCQYEDTVKSDYGLSGFIYERAQQDVKEFRIAVPIDNLVITRPFHVADTTISFFSRDFFDGMIERALARSTDNSDLNELRIEEGLEKLRQKYQGKAYCELVLTAEHDHAVQQAKEVVDLVVSILRFYSPAWADPLIPSYLGTMGHVLVPTDHSFVFESDEPTITEQLSENRTTRWCVIEEDFFSFNEFRMNDVARTLFKSKKNELESIVAVSFQLFSKALAMKSAADKTVFFLVALENLLLANEQESIGVNLSQRLAFLTEKTVNDRKKVVAMVSRAYKIRSKYLHHGRLEEDLDTLRGLQRSTWIAILNTFGLLPIISTKAELYTHLEKQILG